MKSAHSKTVLFVAVMFLAVAFLATMPSQASAQIYVEPGDVVLSINGQSIGSKHDLVSAVNRSGNIMRFTLHDRRTGRILNLATRLNGNGQRFGVYCVDNGGYGAKITGVVQGSAAFRCWNDGGGGAIGAPVPVARPGNSVPRYNIPRNLRPGGYTLPDGTVIQVD